jgi:hypothetical protein
MESFTFQAAELFQQLLSFCVSRFDEMAALYFCDVRQRPSRNLRGGQETCWYGSLLRSTQARRDP